MSEPDPSAMIGRSRETAIRRDAQGNWWNGPDPITHPNLTRSFDGWIARAEDGRLCLSNAINWAYVTIEGPPYFVRAVTLARDSIDAVTLHLSGDVEEKLDPSTLLEAEDGSLTCVVRSNLWARFSAHAAVQLAPVVVEDGQGVGLRGDAGVLRVPRGRR